MATEVLILKDDPANPGQMAQFAKRNADGGMEVHVSGGTVTAASPALFTLTYDEFVLGYSGSTLVTVRTKLAGVNRQLATLTYTGANLTGVVVT